MAVHLCRESESIGRSREGCTAELELVVSLDVDRGLDYRDVAGVAAPSALGRMVAPVVTRVFVVGLSAMVPGQEPGSGVQESVASVSMRYSQIFLHSIPDGARI